MSLLLKNFYSLTDACTLLNNQLNRTDIDVDFLMQLTFDDAIELGVIHQVKHLDLGSIIFEDKQLQFNDNNEIRILLNTSFHYLSQSKFILMADKEDLFEIYKKNQIELHNISFNNIYSILDNTFAIPPNLKKYIGSFNFYSHIPWYNFYKLENVPASSLNPKLDDSMTQTVWFDYFDVSLSSPLEKIILPTNDDIQLITTDDLYILAEDLHKILSNKIKTQTAKTLNIDNFNLGNFTSQKNSPDSVLHTTAYKNGLKIISALAHLAKLDITKHQKAYSILQQHCDEHGIEIPNKDTCGHWFKDIKNL